MVFREGKILLGLRKGADGAGTYSLPGGKLEHLESFEACAHREVEEEAGIRITNVRFQYLANMKTYAPKHWVHIGLCADWEHGEAVVREPGRCERWGWYGLHKLPKNIDTTLAMALESHTENRNYFDS